MTHSDSHSIFTRLRHVLAHVDQGSPDDVRRASARVRRKLSAGLPSKVTNSTELVRTIKGLEELRADAVDRRAPSDFIELVELVLEHARAVSGKAVLPPTASSPTGDTAGAAGAAETIVKINYTDLLDD